MPKNIEDHLKRMEPDELKVGEITDPKVLDAIDEMLKDATLGHPGKVSFHANITAKPGSK
tara:strand:- start:53062 stop:53241 length:180 start_codon:yes stop_codon:yes gene_type:complete